MTDVFVGDNDHGDRVPSSEVLLQMIEQLRAERDEARREVCNLIKWDHYGPRHYAQYRKWDCFKGDTDGTE